MNENTQKTIKKPSDFILNSLIALAEAVDNKKETHSFISVTLNVGGILISGDLISEKRYYQKVLLGKLMKRSKKK